MVEWTRQTFHIAICSFLRSPIAMERWQFCLILLMIYFHDIPVMELINFQSTIYVYFHFQRRSNIFMCSFFYFEELQFDHFVCKVYLSWNCKKISIRFYRFENVRLQPWTQKVKTQNDIFHFSVHKNVILNNHKKIIPVKYSTHQNRRSFKEPSSVDAHKTESSSTMYALNKAVYFEFIEN